MRLDKYISNATDLSRNEVKRLIRSGAVAVDDRVADNAAQKVESGQHITIEGSPIHRPRHRYFMLNKPTGVVSVSRDSDHPTAIDLIYEHRQQELQIAGRLDIDATGLLLITDDGHWNHRLTSPNTECRKLYRVTLRDPIHPNYAEKLSHGIWLEGEKRRCLPATLDIIDDRTVLLGISEGKFHQVKRMFSALGNEVLQLHRTQVGDIILDETLQPGEYRALTHPEIHCI